MNLLVATKNNGKLKEFRDILSPLGYNILCMTDVGIDIDIDIVEDGLSFEENAYKKASELCKIAKIATISDDSGLCIDTLGGAPGIYSARYSGENATDEQNIVKLLADMETVPDGKRGAKFVSAIVLCRIDGTHVTAIGETFGDLLREKDGDSGFGYDPIFFSHELNKSFGRASSQEKNSISHRAKALNVLIDMI